MATVYLTFDDGPLAGTDDVLDVLAAKGLKATLFMVGEHVRSAFTRRQLERAHDSGLVQVANHSQTHAHNHYSAFYADPAGVRADLERANTTLGIAGGAPFHARLPGRNTFRAGTIRKTDGDSGAAADLLAEDGFHLYGWDVEWPMRNGHVARAPAAVLDSVKAALDGGITRRPGHAVLLMHDVMFRASTGGRPELERFCDLLRGSGLETATMASYVPAAGPPAMA